VGYFFGKKLNENLQMPVGLIGASWGGTPAESWVPSDIIEANPALKAAAIKQKNDRPWCPSRPGVVFNAMINPLLPFRIAGAIWYQGESNTAAPSTYKQLMETLILDWRKEFQSELPFYFVQIAPYKGYGDVEKGTLIQEQQVQMQKIPNTGMVVISDLVDNVADIHPQYKRPVGERLANLALAKTYHKSGVVFESPQYASMKVEKSRVRLTFDHAGDGIVSKNGPPAEFVVAGPDHKFYPATAKIDGNTVVVSSREVKEPVAVRYAWANSAMGNLFGKSGLPVSSFRTDDWPIVVD
jgi:sialate O-acetylesterase